MSQLKQIDTLGYVSDEFTSDDAAWISDIKSLENLSIHAPVFDAHLWQLNLLANLRGLEINSKQITNSGLPALSLLTHFQVLSLKKCKVSDRAMEHLLPLTELKQLICRTNQEFNKSVTSLDSLVPVTILETPWREAIDDLRSWGENVRLDEVAMAADGVAVPQTTVNIDNPRGTPLREVLDNLVEPDGLIYVARADGIVITTKAAHARMRPGITALQQALPELEATVTW